MDHSSVHPRVPLFGRAQNQRWSTTVSDTISRFQKTALVIYQYNTQLSPTSKHTMKFLRTSVNMTPVNMIVLSSTRKGKYMFPVSEACVSCRCVVHSRKYAIATDVTCEDGGNSGRGDTMSLQPQLPLCGRRQEKHASRGQVDVHRDEVIQMHRKCELVHFGN